MTAPTAKPAAKAAVASKAVIAAGKAVYTQSCVTCHQPDGGGVQNINPSLIKAGYVTGDKTRLISVLLNGLKQKEIDGEHYSNVMPSFNYLSDAQIAAVLSYVRAGFGNKAGAVSADEVKKTRGN